jgi:nucleotide-binding universal stress UspA family protein
MPTGHVSSSIPTKILLPTDFSSSSHAAREIATDLALHFHAKLYLLNIIQLLPDVSGADFFAETDVFQKAKRNAEDSLAAWDTALTAKGVSVTRRVEASNDVAGSILE